MHEEPDVFSVPERKLSEETEREKFRKQAKSEYLHDVDKHIEDLKAQKSGRGIAFILKYIGACYIVLAIFKGLYFDFTPSFDILGLSAFILGYVLERRIKQRYKYLDDKGYGS